MQSEETVMQPDSVRVEISLWEMERKNRRAKAGADFRGSRIFLSKSELNFLSEWHKFFK